MNEDMNSNNNQNDEFTLNSEENDYKSLISRLQEISKTIFLLEKKIFK